MIMYPLQLFLRCLGKDKGTPYHGSVANLRNYRMGILSSFGWKVCTHVKERMDSYVYAVDSKSNKQALSVCSGCLIMSKCVQNTSQLI